MALTQFGRTLPLLLRPGLPLARAVVDDGAGFCWRGVSPYATLRSWLFPPDRFRALSSRRSGPWLSDWWRCASVVLRCRVSRIARSRPKWVSTPCRVWRECRWSGFVGSRYRRAVPPQAEYSAVILENNPDQISLIITSMFPRVTLEYGQISTASSIRSFAALRSKSGILTLSRVLRK